MSNISFKGNIFSVSHSNDTSFVSKINTGLYSVIYFIGDPENIDPTIKHFENFNKALEYAKNWVFHVFIADDAFTKEERGKEAFDLAKINLEIFLGVNIPDFDINKDEVHSVDSAYDTILDLYTQTLSEQQLFDLFEFILSSKADSETAVLLDIQPVILEP